MTVATTDNKATYVGDGLQTEFGFGFKIFDSDDLEVYTLNTENGDTVKLTLNADYTVSAVNQDYSNGGTVTLIAAPAATYQVVIIRRVEIKQETDFQTIETVNPEVQEVAMDKLTIICQQLYEELARCVRTPVTENTGLVLPTRVLRANKYLAFNEYGDPIVALTAAGMSLLAGSALAYIGDFTESWPTKRPDGVTEFTIDDSGRLALDIGGSRMRFAVYRHGTGWCVLGTVQNGELVMSGPAPMLAFTDSDDTDPNGRIRFLFDGNILKLQRKTGVDPETWADCWFVNQATGVFGGLPAATASGHPMRYDETVRTSDDQTIAGVKTFSSSPVIPTLGPGDNTAKAASAAFVAAAIASIPSSAYGAYTNIDDENNAMLKSHAYRAKQDGAVTVTMTGGGGAGNNLRGYIGSTTDPAGAGTLIQGLVTTGTLHSLVLPQVASGKYFEITYDGTGTLVILWHPKGTLIKPTDAD